MSNPNKINVLNKDEIKDSIDIIDFITLTTPLKQIGLHYWAKCPIHQEDTPSFCVNPSRRMFHCFGCGIHGDIFTFRMHVKKISFIQSIEEICNEYDFNLVGFNKNTTLGSFSRPSSSLMSDICKGYQANIELDIPKLYLHKRGLTEDTIKQFQLGYSPNSGHMSGYLMSLGYSIQDGSSAGILGHSGLDKYADRLIFPILSIQGDVIGFAGRTMDDTVQSKYINSPNIDCFAKSFNLYNQNNLVINQEIIVVEGYMDVIALTQLGIQNVVGIMSTTISREQMLCMWRKTNKIIVMMDGDNAGTSSVKKNLDNLLAYLRPGKEVFIVLIQEKDPDELSKRGLRYVRGVINKKIRLFDWITRFYIKELCSIDDYSTNLQLVDTIVSKIDNVYVKDTYHKFLLKYINNLINQTTNNTKIEDDTHLLENQILAIMVQKINVLTKPDILLLDQLNFKQLDYIKIQKQIINALNYDDFNQNINNLIRENLGDKLDTILQIPDLSHIILLPDSLIRNHFLIILRTLKSRI